MTPAPPQLVLTDSFGASQHLAHEVIGTHQMQPAPSRSLAVSGAVISFPGGSRLKADIPGCESSRARAPATPHYAILTRYREYEIIIPSDQILIMQHRG